MRPITLVDETPIFSELRVNENPITIEELCIAVKKFKLGKAAGPDEHPIEYWRAVLEQDRSSIASTWLLDYCNAVWCRRRVPDSWHIQKVALIYKKGDPSDCGNYRPICLLNAAYKCFAMVLLLRLLQAGADERICSSQFGFRRKRSTEDALHCARRAIEKAWAHKEGSVHLMALDWRKAFDSVNPQSLVLALKRFGFPHQVIEIVRDIYKDRRFHVSECGVQSDLRRQDSGICQGCPLSPFLFVILVSVLLTDAKKNLSTAGQAALEQGCLFEVLYADDTLLVGVQPELVEEFARVVEAEGGKYGMTLHWGKTQVLSVATEERLKMPDCSIV